MRRATLPLITSLRLVPPRRANHASTRSSASQLDTWQDRLRQKLWGKSPPGSPTPYERPAEEAKPQPPTIDHVEATDGRGLRVVGLEDQMQEWDIPTFPTNQKLQSQESIIRAVHRAVVEVYTASLNGHPTSLTYTGPESLTSSVYITVSPDGAASFDYRDSETEYGILASTVAEETQPYTEEEVFPSMEETPEWVVEGMEKSGWTALGLRKEVKFDILKRVLQLTGIRLKDADATKVKSVAQLLECLEYKPKPKKLFEVLKESELMGIPNVKVFGSRVRPWDKERMVGRERPIEEVVEFRYPFEKQAGMGAKARVGVRS